MPGKLLPTLPAKLGNITKYFIVTFVGFFFATFSFLVIYLVLIIRGADATITNLPAEVSETINSTRETISLLGEGLSWIIKKQPKVNLVRHQRMSVDYLGKPIEFDFGLLQFEPDALNLKATELYAYIPLDEDEVQKFASASELHSLKIRAALKDSGQPHSNNYLVIRTKEETINIDNKKLKTAEFFFIKQQSPLRSRIFRFRILYISFW